MEAAHALKEKKKSKILGWPRSLGCSVRCFGKIQMNFLAHLTDLSLKPGPAIYFVSIFTSRRPRLPPLWPGADRHPGPWSLSWGPNQNSRHRGDTQLPSAVGWDPGTSQRPQEGEAGPQYEKDGEVLVQELTAINGQGPGGEAASTDGARCKANHLRWREGNGSPIKKAPRGFSSTQNVRGWVSPHSTFVPFW